MKNRVPRGLTLFAEGKRNNILSQTNWQKREYWYIISNSKSSDELYQSLKTTLFDVLFNLNSTLENVQKKYIFENIEKLVKNSDLIIREKGIEFTIVGYILHLRLYRCAREFSY